MCAQVQTVGVKNILKADLTIHVIKITGTCSLCQYSK